MFGTSVREVYNIIWCQFDLKIDNLILMIGKKKKKKEMVVYRKIIEVSKIKVECKCETNLP